MRLIFSVLCLVLLIKVNAQQVTPSTQGSYLLKNGNIHPVSSPAFVGDLWIENDRLKDIGTDLNPTDAIIIDCTDKHIYPGLIDGGTRLGLEEISSISLTKDSDELGSFNPHMKALTAVNPSSVSIPVTRTNGVTTVLTMPRGGRISGEAALIHLHGYTPEQMYGGFSAVLMNFPSSGKRGRWDRRSEEDVKKDNKKATKKLNEMWASVATFARMDSIASVRNEKKEGYNPQMDAMLPIFKKEAKLLVRVNKKEDILSALKWAKEKEIDIILMSAAEGYMVAKEIAEAKVPVILGPILRNPSRDHERYDSQYTAAKKLKDAGVMFCIMTNEVENVRNLPFNAGFAAAYGLGKEEALKSITLNAAKIFGLEDQIGTLEKGKIANVVVSTGDIFETKSVLTHLFIKGWNIPLESRHTLLYDEFLERSPGIK